MSSDSIADAWLRLWSPTINLPGSGSLGRFTYQPYTTWEAPSLFRGNDAVEQVVYRDVASPGRQLGKLTAVVIELADALAKIDTEIASSDSVKKLKAIAKNIDSVKSVVEDNTESAAKEMLDKLKSIDEERFKKLLKDYASAIA